MNTNAKLTIGMDLGDKTSELCALNVERNIDGRATVTMNPAVLHKFFSKFKVPSRVTVIVEAGTHSPWVSDQLTEMGFGVIIADPRKLKAIWSNNNKSDRNDAELLARMGQSESDLLNQVYHKEHQHRLDLLQIKARDGLVKARTQLVNQVRGLVKSFGGRIAACSAAAFAKVARNAMSAELKSCFSDLLGALDSINKKIDAYDRRIEKIGNTRYGKETQKLRKIKGVGTLTALAFVLVVGDPKRFAKSRHVAPYLGLVPKRDQSGTSDKQLSITKAGNPEMRRLLVNAANYVMGPFGEDCELRRHGERIAARGGNITKRKAKVAVARKLSVLMHRLMLSDEEYNTRARAI